MKKSLKVQPISRDDVRRGWVRIEENTRNRIKSGSLIILSLNNKKLPRIVLGIDERKREKAGNIYMDEPTREFFEIYGNDKPLDFIITQPKGICKDYYTLKFYWNHPEFITRASSKMAITSLILAILSIILTLISFVTSKDIMLIIILIIILLSIFFIIIRFLACLRMC